MANDYSTSTDAFADIVESGYSSSDYPVMATFITAASRLIDAKMGRWAGFFYPTTDSETRYYDGSGEREQPIDEMVSLPSAVAVAETGIISASSDYTAWSSSVYFAYPYNWSAMGKPITRLVIDYNVKSAVWYRFRKSVSVTGIFGYSTTIPELVAAATRLQAVRWFMKAKQGYQQQGASIEMGGLTFTAEPKLDVDIVQMLWPLMLELGN